MIAERFPFVSMTALLLRRWVVGACCAVAMVALPVVMHATGCPVGFLNGTSIPAAQIDGVRGPEWNDASVIASGSSCMNMLYDWDGASPFPPSLAKTVTLYSKRDGNTLYLAFEVMDGTQNLSGGALVLGERVILCFDPDPASSPGGLAGDYRIDVGHKWAAAGPGLQVDRFFYTPAGSASGLCVPPQVLWQVAGSFPAAIQVAARTSTGGYVVELSIPLSQIGNPAGNFGFAFAVINDLGHCTTGACASYDATGIAFPNSLPITNMGGPLVTDPLNPISCGPWVTPSTWGTGTFSPPPSDVTISQLPAWWNSQDILALACGTPNYTYYPLHPCRLQLQATVHNAGSPQPRNILYLWAEHGSGPVTWRVVDLKEGVMVPTGNPTILSADWSGVPTGLTNHPCVRVYILPPTFLAAFDRAHILNITSQADVDMMEIVYNITTAHWAQKNISANTTIPDCPDVPCRIAALGPPHGVGSIAGNVPAGPEEPEAAPASAPLPVWGVGIVLVAVVGLGTRFKRRWSRRTASLSILLLASLIAWSCKKPIEPVIVKVPSPVALSSEELKRYGPDNLVVQVRAMGYSALKSAKPSYNFIEDLGGVIQLFPAKVVATNGNLMVRLNVTNPGNVERTIMLKVDMLIPKGTPKMRVDLDTRPQLFKAGETRVVFGRLVRDMSLKDTVAIPDTTQKR
jgi:hypothetical protein